ncbi:hypothetical protein [Sphingomonas tagetis]|uniref:hypothetical protein n=1 Tax=Sphingomonas tagetis TaxID=2949092 RepID=UPI0020B65CAB|nr:hypothetical protein [Sphingomonas tagetis]
MEEPSRIARLMADGDAARRDGRSADARHCFGEAVHACREDGDLICEAHALTRCAQVARDTGNLDWAIHDQQEAIALYRKAGAGPELAHALRHAGEMFLEQQRHAHAATSLHEALDLYRADAEAAPLDVANALRAAALLAETLDERDEARRFWTDARSLYESSCESGVVEADQRLAALG